MSGLLSRRDLLRAMAAASVVAACGAPPDVGSRPGAAALIKSDVARATSDPKAAASGAAAIEALTADLYRELGAKSGNLFYSPYSVEIALAMARAGAAGKTRDEMDRVLHVSTAFDLDTAINALDQELAKRSGKYPYGDGKTTVELELSPADQLFGQRGFTFEQAFLDRLAASYGAGMRVVDYMSASAREQARGEINKWVSERTHDRIPELIKQGVLSELTRLVITNALYFKGKWMIPFAKPATAAAPFHRLDGSTSQAQLMSLSGRGLGYAQGAGYTAMLLPYVGGVSMLVVAPDAGSFAAVETRVRDTSLLKEIAGATKHDAGIRLRMPKFTFRSQSLLKPALSALGMPTAFTDQADFSGISKANRMIIQDVVHEAFVAVDEEGTEAAAATAVLVGVTSAPSKTVELTIDRPFFFAIRDDATGTILFFGRVVDPV
jgi:serpin B